MILMAGLQGSGKTTATAKLAKHLAGEEQAASRSRPATPSARPRSSSSSASPSRRARPSTRRGPSAIPVDIAEWALGQARAEEIDVLIVDTAGRLHIDEELMDQLVQIKRRTKPHDVLLVVDAMTGQDAVNVAEQFAEATEFDGVVMTKLDGDARGGAALCVKAVTGKPILYASTGEKLEQLEKFHPDRMAQRILGMGDVLSLIEKAEKEMDTSDAEELERKMRQDQFTLDDFLKQLKQIRKMGPLTSVLGMMPGMGKAMKELRGANLDDRELDRLEAIILSMTPEERANPDIIRGSRRRRIAAGSGTNVQAVKQLTKQFDQMRKMMKQIASGKMPNPEALLRGQLGGRPPMTAGRFRALSLPRLMAVRIRLRRAGSSKNPIWRIVVADKRSPRDGRTIETIGSYNPQTRALAGRDRHRAGPALARPRGAALANGREAAAHPGRRRPPSS